jgi:hypothetical protein
VVYDISIGDFLFQSNIRLDHALISVVPMGALLGFFFVEYPK